jgi:hypothetical protein
MATDESPKIERSRGFRLFRLVLGVGVAAYVLLHLWAQYPQYWPWHCKEGEAFLDDDDCNWCQCRNARTVCTLMLCGEAQKETNRALAGRPSRKH